MNRLFNFSLLILFCLSLSLCDRDNDIIIKINSHAVPASQFYQTVPDGDHWKYSPQELKRKLTEYAHDELMLYDAQKIKLHKEPSFTEQIETYRHNTLIEEYFQRTVVDSVIPESYLLHTYANLSLRFRNAHPYSKYRERLFEKALSEKKYDLQNAFYALMERTSKNYSLTFDDSALVYFSNLYNETFRRLYSQNSHDVSPHLVLNNINDNRIIVKTKKRSYTKSWLQEEIKRRRIDLPFGTINPDLFKDIFETLIVEDIFYKKSHRKNYDKSPLYKKKLENYKRSTLLSRYKAEMIYDSINSNEDSLYSFYQRNKDTHYLSPSKAEVCEIFIKDSLRASEILRISRNTKDFFALAKKNTERFRNQKKPGYLGFITAEQYGGIGKAAQKLSAGEVCDRLIRSGDGFSIIKSFSYIPPEPKDFEAVKANVVQDYTNEKYTFVSDSLLSALKEKYRFEIFFDKLSNM